MVKIMYTMCSDSNFFQVEPMKTPPFEKSVLFDWSMACGSGWTMDVKPVQGVTQTTQHEYVALISIDNFLRDAADLISIKESFKKSQLSQ
jgi:hypothetical protein